MNMRSALTAGIAFGILSSIALTPATADVKDRLYDFTDACYLANGINPAKLAGRKQAPSTTAVVDTPFFSWQRNVRVIGTSGGYAANGSVAFFSVLAGFGPDGFTNDAAGARARQIADAYSEFVFPQRTADPLGLGGARQTVVLNTDNGYFSNNPLGLWLHVWVSYTDRAFNTADGKKMLDDLARRNGLSLDGTPIIKTKSEIEGLYSKGFVTLRTRNDGLRYAVCPIIKDPTNGGIAPDAFLNTAKKPDGSPLDPAFPNNFTTLQLYGTWLR